MARIRLETGVADLAHLWMVLQESGHGHRIGAVLFHPDAQGLCPTQDEEAVEWPWNRPDRVLKELESLEHRLVVGDHGTAHDVGVSPQIFRRGVNHDIGAKLQRPLQKRRRKRVVHHHLHVVPMSDVARGGDITDCQ